MFLKHLSKECKYISLFIPLRRKRVQKTLKTLDLSNINMLNRFVQDTKKKSTHSTTKKGYLVLYTPVFLQKY